MTWCPTAFPSRRSTRVMNKRAISNLIDTCYRQVGLKETVVFADQLMYTGFSYATRAGLSIGVDDMEIPPEKRDILGKAEAEVKEVQEQFRSGFLTNGERYNKVVDIWSQTNDHVANAMMEKLGSEVVRDAEGNEVTQPSFNPIFMMADSGARGSAAQIRQLAGMRGPDGEAGRLHHRDAHQRQLPRRGSTSSSTSSPPTARARASPTPPSRPRTRGT